MPKASTDDSTSIETLPSRQALISATGEFTDNLIVFSDTAIWYGSLKPEALAQATSMLLEGEFLHDQFSGWKEPIAYESISEVECNLYDNMVTIGEADSFGSRVLMLHDARSRNQFLDLIADKLGDGWNNEVRYYNRLNATGLPVFCLAILSVILALILWASTFPELDPAKAHIRPRRRNLILLVVVQILSLIGWFGLACTIGSFMFAALIWLAFRIAVPPIEWALKKADTAAGSDSETRTDRAEDSGTSAGSTAEPVAWISRKRIKKSQTDENGECAAETAADSTNNAKAIGIVGWGIIVSVFTGLSFAIGRILVITDVSAWIFNAVFLGIHLLMLFWVIRRVAHDACNTNMASVDDVTPGNAATSTFTMIFSSVLIILCVLSGSMLSIKPSDHIVFSAFATGLSCMGALFFVQSYRRRFRRQLGRTP